MSSCAVARRDLDAFLALELDAERERELRAHLAECATCRDLVEEAEPAALLAARMAAVPGPGPDDEAFVAAVLAGVRERSLEASLARRRGLRRWLAAAAVALAAGLGGWLLVDRPVAPVAAESVEPAAAEPAFVEVEGQGVRVYELAPSPDGGVRVAFIVDPGLEI